MGSRLSNGEVMRGIFIKHILEDSPAGHNGTLKTGDRIVEVQEVFLTFFSAVLQKCCPSKEKGTCRIPESVFIP